MEGRRDPLADLRPAAGALIAQNARLIEATPSQTRPRRAAPSPFEPLSSFPGGFADGLEKHLSKRAPPPATRNERLARGLTKAHLKGVGWAGDAAELVTAEDKGRAAASIAGGRAGAAVGAFIPPELVTIPAGSVVGSAAGKFLYDRYGPGVGDAIRSSFVTLRDQLGRELTRYVPYDLPDRILRR